MLIFGFYFLFLTVFSLVGAGIGFVVDGRYPGMGTFVTVAIFMIALWGAWTLSVRIIDRFWPDQPAA